MLELEPRSRQLYWVHFKSAATSSSLRSQSRTGKKRYIAQRHSGFVACLHRAGLCAAHPPSKYSSSQLSAWPVESSTALSAAIPSTSLSSPKSARSDSPVELLESLVAHWFQRDAP